VNKHKGPTQPKPWGKWEPTKTVRNTLSGAEVALGDDEICWLNNLYTVVGRRLAGTGESPSMIWLSIRRNDRKPARDWRHLQRIKNELVGPECEAMEMFPAESRLVDQANQTHIWVVLDPKFRWPWGFTERVVKDHDDPDVRALGAVQRPLEVK
jgi:hypothetical protein